MDWVSIVLKFRDVFLLAYVLFVIWSLATWIHALKLGTFTLRDWFGSFGLVIGSFSAMMFGWYFLFLGIERRLIAHGSLLWLYYYGGECLALLGLALGLIGRRRLRLSATIVSLVMIFLWYGRMVVGREAEAIVTITMLLLLALWAVIWLWRRTIMRRSGAITV